MKNSHIGSSFDNFLAEEAILEETTAVAMKRIIAWQIEQEMKAQKLTKPLWQRKCIQAEQPSIGFLMRLTLALH